MTKPQALRIYRMDAIRRWGLCGGAILLSVIPFVAADSEADGYQWQPAMIASGLVLPLAAALLWLSHRVRLEMTDSGCALFSPGMSMQANWAEVQYISARLDLPGVVLKRPQNSPGMRRQQWFANRSSYDSSNYNAQQLELISKMRFIDLRAFRRQLGSAEFAEVAAGYRVKYQGDRTHN